VVLHSHPSLFLWALTERNIHPYELMLLNGSWYCLSYCEKRKALRQFKITRIRQISIQKDSFVRSHVFEKAQKKDQEKVTLHFIKESLGKLYDFFTDKEMTIKNDSIEVSFYTDQIQSLLSLLLMFGNDVQVIHPIKLKQQHLLAIKNLQLIY